MFDDRRKQRGFVRHRVRHIEPEEPQPVQSTEKKLEARAPAYVAYGFATREAFMEWRLGLLKQIDRAHHAG